MSGAAAALLVAALGATAATAAISAFRLARARSTADRLLALQLLVAKAIAALFLMAAATGADALAETGLILALLGAVTAAVFAQGGRDVDR
jgi:Multiple resistance and pH regulation protein F (MrpF / PhaF).